MNFAVAPRAQRNEILFGVNPAKLKLDYVVPVSRLVTAHKTAKEPLPRMQLGLGVIELSPPNVQGLLLVVFDLKE